MIYGNSVGGLGIERTYILTDEAGNEYPATYVDYETTFDATSNDIRIGKYAATSEGVIRGTKEIPAYYTTEGLKAIPAGKAFSFVLATGNRYDYTKLQALICAFNTKASDSVATEKVCINDNVYDVGSTDSIATVIIDANAKAINLGITNDTTKPYVLRYFTYKEEP